MRRGPPRLVVYSARTIDIGPGGSWRRGGPYVFARDALTGLLLARVVPGCRGSYAVFEHVEERGERRSFLLREPGRCTENMEAEGVAALVSPVYWELAVEDVALIARGGFGAVAVDLQGFTRFRDAAGRVAVSPAVALSAANYLEETVSGPRWLVFKASIEDLGGLIHGAAFLSGTHRALRVVTLGHRGSCFSYGGSCFYCKPVAGDASLPAVGAGDVFSAALALFLAEGEEPPEAVCRATSFTEAYLSARAGAKTGHRGTRLLGLPCCDCCLARVVSPTRGYEW